MKGLLDILTSTGTLVLSSIVGGFIGGFISYRFGRKSKLHDAKIEVVRLLYAKLVRLDIATEALTYLYEINTKEDIEQQSQNRYKEVCEAWNSLSWYFNENIILLDEKKEVMDFTKLLSNYQEYLYSYKQNKEAHGGDREWLRETVQRFIKEKNVYEQQTKKIRNKLKKRFMKLLKANTIF